LGTTSKTDVYQNKVVASIESHLFPNLVGEEEKEEEEYLRYIPVQGLTNLVLHRFSFILTRPF
jgi:hypothetical protein